jgi:hypothetical protein
MSTRLTRQQTEALADQVGRLLDQVRSDELTASTSTRYRLEGALVALEVVLGRVGGLVERLTQNPDA